VNNFNEDIIKAAIECLTDEEIMGILCGKEKINDSLPESFEWTFAWQVALDRGIVWVLDPWFKAKARGMIASGKILRRNIINEEGKGKNENI